MAVSKRFLKSKPVCKVGFKLPKAAANGATEMFLVGEFNEWNTKATPMKPLKDGSFSVSLDLESGREYQYRYLSDSGDWINDPDADRFEFSAFASGDNCVVCL